jgi:hypothetical protein
MLQGGRPRLGDSMRPLRSLDFFNLPNSSPPSISRMSRKCGILNISYPYRPPLPVIGIT